jgi:hypothetical protein
MPTSQNETQFQIGDFTSDRDLALARNHSCNLVKTHAAEEQDRRNSIIAKKAKRQEYIKVMGKTPKKLGRPALSVA